MFNIYIFFIAIITTKIAFRNYKYQTSKKNYCITTMYVLTITVTRKNKERTEYIVKITYILYYKIARLVNRGKNQVFLFGHNLLSFYEQPDHEFISITEV